jgi:hypothetical protein
MSTGPSKADYLYKLYQLDGGRLTFHRSPGTESRHATVPLIHLQRFRRNSKLFLTDLRRDWQTFDND